jgi:hypothetical protein
MMRLVSIAVSFSFWLGMYDLSPTIGLNTKVKLQQMSNKIKPKLKKKLAEFLPKSLSVFLFSVGANFSEARMRRNSSPQPPPSAASERSGIFQKMVSSRVVKIHQNLTFCKFADHFGGRAKRVASISPRQILSARRGEPRLAVGQDEVRLPRDFYSVSNLLCQLLTNQNI